MKARIIITTAIIFLFNISFSYGQTVYGFSDGLSAAKSTGKKIMLDIYSASDNWSKKMESEVLSSSNVISALSGFIYIKLNADASGKYKYNGKEYSATELSSLFGGTGYPTFVFMNPDGSLIRFKYNGDTVSYLSGFIGETDFAEMLNYFAQDKYKDTDLSTIFQN